MDLSQYADLFLVEAREHLTACNELLLEWERHPAAREPVSGLFRSVHTVKGMAATMGYARVADLAGVPVLWASIGPDREQTLVLGG